ncbi:MAG: quinohemoprotein amine dehydrogenase subunit gamma [Acidobacteriota bacterium]
MPDYLSNHPDWHSSCASATQDWRKIDLVFP